MTTGKRPVSLALALIKHTVFVFPVSFLHKSHSIKPFYLFPFSLHQPLEQQKTRKMADMMFYMKKNKEKEAIKAKERQEKAALKDVLITDTAESAIRKEQHGRDQQWKETGRHTKSNLKDVNMATASIETEIRKEQHAREKQWKQTGRETKSNLKDVNMATASIETEIRKEQHEREQGWKQTGRDTKNSLKDVNMATATVESDIRKEQHQREQQWKQTGRETKTELADVNIAQAFYS